tara:strand:- start:1697 stop:1996 length:300 start_codon:yes stop_codon:yes gene_type:complete
MRSVLYIAKDADEAVAIPTDNVRFIHPESATVVAVYFSGDDGGLGSLNLTVTDGQAYNVVRAIAKALVGGKGVVTIADDIAGAYCHSGIEAVAAVTITA